MTTPSKDATSLLILTEGGNRTGTGHVMRCLALAEAWRAAGGGAVCFAVWGALDGLEVRISQAGCDLLAPLDSNAAAVDLSKRFGLVVIDRPAHDGALLKSLAAASARLLVIDDNALCESYAGDFLLNPNLYAGPDLYRGRAAGTELLLGPSYALLRSEFRAAPKRATARDGYGVALTLGGADPLGATPALASALAPVLGPADLLRVIRGPAAAWPGSAIATPTPGPKLEVTEAPRGMVAALGDVDLVVSAAGTTLLELAALGLPVVALQNVPAERRAAATAAELGFARDLGPVTDLDPGKLQETVAALLADLGQRAIMSDVGRSLVDGRGAARVVAALMGSPREGAPCWS